MNSPAFTSQSDTQREISDLVERFLRDRCPNDYVCKRCHEGWRADTQFQQNLNELGLFELFLESDEVALPELCLIAELCGRYLTPEATVDNILSGPYLLKLLRAEGVAVDLPGVRGVSASARSVISNEQGRVSFDLPGVFFAKEATHLIVSDELGSSYLIDMNVDGVQVESARPGLDLVRPLHRVRCDRVPSRVISTLTGARFAAARRLLALAGVYGALSAVLDQTLAYVKTREQFSRPIGSFQAVQHKLADMKAHHAASGSLLAFVRWSSVSAERQFALALDALHLYLDEHATPCIEAAIQIYGGIGFTWECPLHYYLRYVQVSMAMHVPSMEMRAGLLQRIDFDLPAK